MSDTEEHAQQPLKVTDEQLGILQGGTTAEGIELDLGNLTAFDPSAPPTRDGDEAKAQATALTQALLNALLQLPSESTSTGRTATLPPPSTPLPRAKPLPKPREPTKWEKFAQKKGIVKHKRSKMVFDEAGQSWKRRHGYDATAVSDPIRDAAPGDQPGEDPFSEERRQKKERVKKQAARQMDNMAHSRQAAGGVPASVQLAASLPQHGKGRPQKRLQMQGAIHSAAARANKSTASMGKFDKKAAGEKVKPGAGARKKKLPVAMKNGKEKDAQRSFVSKLIRERE